MYVSVRQADPAFGNYEGERYEYFMDEERR